MRFLIVPSRDWKHNKVDKIVMTSGCSLGMSNAARNASLGPPVGHKHRQILDCKSIIFIRPLISKGGSLPLNALSTFSAHFCGTNQIPLIIVVDILKWLHTHSYCTAFWVHKQISISIYLFLTYILTLQHFGWKNAHIAAFLPQFIVFIWLNRFDFGLFL